MSYIYIYKDFLWLSQVYVSVTCMLLDFGLPSYKTITFNAVLFLIVERLRL